MICDIFLNSKKVSTLFDLIRFIFLLRGLLMQYNNNRIINKILIII